MAPFNELLKERRDAAGITQEQLARAAGMSVSAISKLEQKSDIDPSWSTVQRLAAAMGLDCTAFSAELAPPNRAAGSKPRGTKGKTRKAK